MEVGDKVRYVPEKTYAMMKDARGDRPWVIGRRKLVKGKAGKLEETVEELEGEALEEFLGAVRRSNDPESEAKNIVLVRPKGAWSALVRNMNEDGTVDLDVQSPNTGVVLHLDGIAVDEGRAGLHSCHTPTEEELDDHDYTWKHLVKNFLPNIRAAAAQKEQQHGGDE